MHARARIKWGSVYRVHCIKTLKLFIFLGYFKNDNINNINYFNLNKRCTYIYTRECRAHTHH